jgi:hypothetical protein
MCLESVHDVTGLYPERFPPVLSALPDSSRSDRGSSN